ncbi:hypothetical protein FXV91_17245 [Methanosarcina sp. DH2]|uniref:hypothetical protein n=1 Tax=Methanosarcina sp. DH2 TaxID=2605639 RepID=UPI001E2C79B3|nr:hypothetical protein [Methanosarcina sp. DH2]MCC4771846.1 hypothetical protein [Methanosarcina sp. DH2]
MKKNDFNSSSIEMKFKCHQILSENLEEKYTSKIRFVPAASEDSISKSSEIPSSVYEVFAEIVQDNMVNSVREIIAFDADWNVLLSSLNLNERQLEKLQNFFSNL